MAKAKQRKPGKKEKRLREIAADLHKDNLSFDDTISLCEYVSRKMGTELTINDASKVEGFMATLEADDEKYAASIHAISVIDCTDAENFTVEQVKTFNADEEGEQAARQVFGEWVRESQADDDEVLSDMELDTLFQQGKHEVGEGFIAVVRSV